MTHFETRLLTAPAIHPVGNAISSARPTKFPFKSATTVQSLEINLSNVVFAVSYFCGSL